MTGQLPEDVEDLLAKSDSAVVIGVADDGAMYAELNRGERLTADELAEMSDLLIQREARRRGCPAFEARWR